MNRHAVVFSLLTGLCLAQDQGTELWIQDFAAAKAKAKAEKKDLLVDFTGSDWCGWCIKLDEEVFSKDEFQAEAPQHFVLVKLDYPRDKSILTEAVIKQNEELQATYSIQGYPTILLMSHDGYVYGQTGYQKGGAAPYNAMLADMKKKGAGFQAGLSVAMTKKGLERAAALDDCLSEIDDEVVANYHFELMKEIVELDAEGKAGLKDKYTAKVTLIEQTRMVNTAAQDLNKLIAEHMEKQQGPEALAKLDGVIAEPKSVIHKQMALYFKGMITMDVSRDAAAAVALLEKAREVAPESPLVPQIDRVLPQLKKQAGGDK